MHPLLELLGALVLVFVVEEFVTLIIGLWPLKEEAE